MTNTAQVLPDTFCGGFMWVLNSGELGMLVAAALVILTPIFLFALISYLSERTK